MSTLLVLRWCQTVTEHVLQVNKLVIKTGFILICFECVFSKFALLKDECINSIVFLIVLEISVVLCNINLAFSVPNL